MEPITTGLELKLRKTRVDRWIKEMKNIEDIRQAAFQLNELWTQETTISKAMAHEAAQNLGEAWGMSRLRVSGKDEPWKPF